MAISPLLLTLPVSLKAKLKVHLDNRPQLATAVNQAKTKKVAGLIAPKALGPIPLATGDHEVQPIELLHAIGRWLTPPTAALWTSLASVDT